MFPVDVAEDDAAVVGVVGKSPMKSWQAFVGVVVLADGKSAMIELPPSAPPRSLRVFFGVEMLMMILVAPFIIR